LQGICNGGTFNYKGSKTIIPADCIVIILSNRTPEEVYGLQTDLSAFYERFEVEEMRWCFCKIYLKQKKKKGMEKKLIAFYERFEFKKMKWCSFTI